MAENTMMEKNKFIVEEYLPNYKKEDIKININKKERTLEITAEKCLETTNKKEEQKGDFKIYYYEKQAETFYKAIPIPDGINMEDVKTTFHKDGTLTIEFMK